MSKVAVKFGAEDTNLSSTLNKVQKDLKQVENQSKETSRHVGASFKSMAAMASVVGAGVAVGFAAARTAMAGVTEAARLMAGSVVSASDMGETISKVGQIFGDSASEIESWASSSAKSMGQSKQQAMDAASQFAIFGKAAGLSGSSLTGFSKELTELATDLSSFNNTTPEEAILAIGSALRGEAEPMRRFGVLLDDASLRTEALKMGLIETTKEALTPQQKVLAAHALIMNQTSVAQGDFARTSGGFANQSKILTAQIRDLGIEIGQFLLPGITKITAAFNDNALPAVAAFFGQFKGAGATGDWATSMLDGIAKVSDVMTGVFLQPMAAVNAIGSALSAYFRTAGNVYLNGLIAGGKFLANFWTSEIPSLILSVVSSSLQKAYANSVKFFIDQMLAASKSIEFDLSKAVSSVIRFAVLSLSDVVKFLASDLGQALTNPLDYAAGKILSSLSGAAKAGGLTFESAFTEGTETSLGKLSKGLGEVSSQYGEDVKNSIKGIGSEFGKIIELSESDSVDFFGAKSATEQMKKDFAEIEASGKRFRESISGKGEYDMRKDIQELKPASTWFKDNMIVAANATKDAAKSIKDALSLSEEIMKRIADFREKEKVDPGGKLSKKADEAISSGNVKKAERISKQIEEREQNQAIREKFGEKEGSRVNKSLRDIAKEQGVDTFRKSNEQIRKELLEKEGKGKGGFEKDGGREKIKEQDIKNDQVMTSIKNAVEAIKKAVEKIEPKLPQKALAP